MRSKAPVSATTPVVDQTRSKLNSLLLTQLRLVRQPTWKGERNVRSPYPSLLDGPGNVPVTVFLRDPSLFVLDQVVRPLTLPVLFLRAAPSTATQSAGPAGHGAALRSTAAAMQACATASALTCEALSGTDYAATRLRQRAPTAGASTTSGRASTGTPHAAHAWPTACTATRCCTSRYATTNARSPDSTAAGGTTTETGHPSRSYDARVLSPGASDTTTATADPGRSCTWSGSGETWGNAVDLRL